jgi:hypothetical protein
MGLPPRVWNGVAEKALPQKTKEKQMDAVSLQSSYGRARVAPRRAFKFVSHRIEVDQCLQI